MKYWLLMLLATAPGSNSEITVAKIATYSSKANCETAQKAVTLNTVCIPIEDKDDVVE